MAVDVAVALGTGVPDAVPVADGMADGAVVGEDVDVAAGAVGVPVRAPVGRIASGVNVAVGFGEDWAVVDSGEAVAVGVLVALPAA